MESINFYDAKCVRAGLLSDFFMSGCFNFSKSVLCATIPPMTISIFQKSVFCPWIFFKKWRFTPQNCVRVVSIFEKSVLRASITSATVIFFSRAGDPRRKNTVCCSLKNKTLRKPHTKLNIIRSECNFSISSLIKKHSETLRINNISDHFSYLLKIDLMNHTHILDEYL